MPYPRYLTSGQAAAALGICNATLHRAVRKGLIRPAFRTRAGYLRFLEVEIERFRQASATLPATPPAHTARAPRSP